MNRCYMPECSTPIVDPSSNKILADVCHINAARPGGPRFDANQTPEDRHGFANLLLLCGTHHKLVDAPGNFEHYTADRLKAIKADHEDAAKASRAPIPSLTAELLRELLDSAVKHNSPSITMDFRNAAFSSGGHGGNFGGGGGHGGVINIIGALRPPEGAELDLNGKAPAPGAFGAGGGGGGAIRYTGRAITSEDIDYGLRVSSVFAADAATVTGLLNVLNGGWSWMTVSTLPSQVAINLVGVVELGVVHEALVRLDLDVVDPQGNVVHSDVHHLPIPSSDCLTPRTAFVHSLRFEVTQPGVWVLRVRSADIELASYEVEVRSASPEAPRPIAQ